MKKENSMSLELLPNEILLDLFDYFYGIDLLRTFFGLNSRFNFLLYKQFRSYYFQFQSMSKSNSDMICQQHLPFITDQRANRTDFFWIEFGSVRFDFIFEKPVWFRFGSTEFSKSRFEFGSFSLSANDTQCVILYIRVSYFM